MKERPILFSGPMVRAILEGRKTQTRRVIKPQPSYQGYDGPPKLNSFGEFSYPAQRGFKCPYGQPGDRLWVRETWNAWRQCNLEYNEWDTCGFAPSEIKERYGAVKLEYAATSESVGPWRPSIHMPRWASRITLEIMSVRVERLQDVSEEDARAEGCEWSQWSFPNSTRPGKSAYRALWESIHGHGSWDQNPWVWVVEFKEVKP